MVHVLLSNDVELSKRYYDVHCRGLCPIQKPPTSGPKEDVPPERIQGIFKELSEKLSGDNVSRYTMFKRFDIDNDGKHSN